LNICPNIALTVENDGIFGDDRTPNKARLWT